MNKNYLLFALTIQIVVGILFSLFIYSVTKSSFIMGMVLLGVTILVFTLFIVYKGKNE